VSFRDGFLSDLIGRTAVLDTDGARSPVGRVTDFVVQRPDDMFPRIDALTIKTKDGVRLALIGDVMQVDDDGTIVLRVRPTTPAPPEDEALYLVEDLLDKQIVDVDGRKVVRINDLELAYASGFLHLMAAETGVAGLLRRLGVSRLAPGLVNRVPRTLIAWNNVAPFQDLNPSEIRLSVSEGRLSRLHPSDLAEIVGDLSVHDAARVVGSLDDETAADTFEHLDAERQISIIDDLGTERAADIIEEMESDDAADLLGELPRERQRELLAEMDAETADDLRELVGYREDTAGGLMTTDYVWIYPHRTVEATLAKLRELAPETEFIYYLYVLDSTEKLLGAVSLRTLLLAAPDATIDGIMDTDLVTVQPGTSAEDVTSLIARYDLLACPVLEDDKLVGIVTVDDAIDAIIPERLKQRLPRFTKPHKQTAEPHPS
jgi:CBS domain-containing protein